MHLKDACLKELPEMVAFFVQAMCPTTLNPKSYSCNELSSLVTLPGWPGISIRCFAPRGLDVTLQALFLCLTKKSRDQK